MKKEVVCNYCGSCIKKEVRDINRAIKHKKNLFCNKTCSGLRRRSVKTEGEKRDDKKIYDLDYRNKNHEKLKIKKRAYHLKTYDPKVAAKERKLTMGRHVEYCRRPEYVKYKRVYDQKRRASAYGEFSESYLLVLELNNITKERIKNEKINRQ